MVWYNLHIPFQLCQTSLRKPMTSYTETTQTITETINSMDYNTGYQYSTTGSGITASGNLAPTPTTNNVSINGVNSTWTGVGSKPSFTQTTPGANFQFTETYKGPGLSNHTIIQRTTEVTSCHRYYKYILAIILSGSFPSQTLAETIGGVSARFPSLIASAVLLTRQFRYYKDPTLRILMGEESNVRSYEKLYPYVTGTAFNRNLMNHIIWTLYTMLQITSAPFDADGNPIGDGILDNPGDVLFHKRTRTGQKDNYSLG